MQYTCGVIKIRDNLVEGMVVVGWQINGLCTADLNNRAFCLQKTLIKNGCQFSSKVWTHVR
jgi:hypothetical protein